RRCCVNRTAATAIYTLSLHDALPILPLTKRSYRSLKMQALSWIYRITMASLHSNTRSAKVLQRLPLRCAHRNDDDVTIYSSLRRSEEHTSELQSRENLVCRLLLEKKK